MIRLFFFAVLAFFLIEGSTPSLAKKSDKDYMPPISGMDLTGTPRKIPPSLDRNLSIIIFAFTEEQQKIVNQWLPFVTGLQRHNDDLEFYEVIIYDIANPDATYWSNDAMRKGILKRDDSDHTITVFLDNKTFLKNMEMQGDTIYTMLINNHNGKIHWRTNGGPTAEKQENLEKAIRDSR